MVRNFFGVIENHKWYLDESIEPNFFFLSPWRLYTPIVWLWRSFFKVHSFRKTINDILDESINTNWLFILSLQVQLEWVTSSRFAVFHISSSSSSSSSASSSAPSSSSSTAWRTSSRRRTRRSSSRSSRSPSSSASPSSATSTPGARWCSPWCGRHGNASWRQRTSWCWRRWRVLCKRWSRRWNSWPAWRSTWIPSREISHDSWSLSTVWTAVNRKNYYRYDMHELKICIE